MPIPGEAWGEINKYEKSKVGEREFDVRETLVTNAMNDAANKIFEPNINPSEELYAVILRKESDTIVSNGSATPALARFRCYVFSGPHAEIPFSLEVLGYSNPSSRSQVKVDDLTTEMMPIFTCKNKNLSDSLKGAQEGTIVKVLYGNRNNLSDPIIVDTTSFPPLVPESSKKTIEQFSNNIKKGVLRTDGFASELVNGEPVSSQNANKNDRLRKLSLSFFNNRSLQLNWPVVGRQVNIDYGKTRIPNTFQASKKYSFRFHNGIDISGKKEENILSAEFGKVIKAERLGGYGLYVQVLHRINGSIFTTLYAHLNSIAVTVGQMVFRGQKIGGMGTTGNSVGIHLHFELQRNGRRADPIPHFSNAPTPIYSPLSDTIRRETSR